MKIILTIVADINRNHHPEICVIDNGPGIIEENLDKIFVPFFTTRKNGSGIGLSVSRQIMRIHGGTLKVRSVPNKETIFILSFMS
jgi:signal transduction histidine kinase